MNRWTAVILMAALAGCVADMENRPKQTLGTLGGAALGGILGSQIGKGDGQLMAVGIATLLGAATGGEIGKSLDAADRLAAEQAAQAGLETAPIGKATRWHNPNSGNAGDIVPTRTFETASGPCREYTQTILIGGTEHTAHGTACRQPDGSWTLAN